MWLASPFGNLKLENLILIAPQIKVRLRLGNHNQIQGERVFRQRLQNKKCKSLVIAIYQCFGRKVENQQIKDLLFTASGVSVSWLWVQMWLWGGVPHFVSRAPPEVPHFVSQGCLRRPKFLAPHVFFCPLLGVGLSFLVT